MHTLLVCDYPWLASKSERIAVIVLHIDCFAHIAYVLQMASVIKILSSSKIQEMEKQPLRIDADMCGCLPEKN